MSQLATTYPAREATDVAQISPAPARTGHTATNGPQHPRLPRASMVSVALPETHKRRPISFAGNGKPPNSQATPTLRKAVPLVRTRSDQPPRKVQISRASVSIIAPFASSRSLERRVARFIMGQGSPLGAIPWTHLETQTSPSGAWPIGAIVSHVLVAGSYRSTALVRPPSILPPTA